MENLRQRTKKEVEAASQFAVQKFSKDIVQVADVLEMAYKSTESATESNAEKRLDNLMMGLSMVMVELQKTFGRHGITVMDLAGGKFDPNQHNALFEVPDEQVEPGTIVSVQKPGYMLHGRVLRAADVGIAKKAPN